MLWIWVLIYVFIDIFRSRDLSGWAKALWFIFVLFIPLIGVLVYLIARGDSMHERAVQQAQQQDADTPPTSSRPRVRRTRLTSSASWPTCVTAASSRPMSSNARRLRFSPPEGYRGGMTQDAVETASSLQEQHLLRGWRSVMFAPVGSGRDAGTEATACGWPLPSWPWGAACWSSGMTRVSTGPSAVIHPPPRSITWLVTVASQAGSFGVVVVVAGVALLARRWEIARDLGLSARRDDAGAES